MPNKVTLSTKKVAIIHDWLIGGGAEQVVLQLHKMFPDAPIYTSYCTNGWNKKLGNKVVTGYLQRWPFPTLRKFIPFLRAYWFSRRDLSGYDLIISSSGAEAKFIRTKTTHVAYIHAPTHYYWSRYEDYQKNPGFPIGFNWLARIGLRILLNPMRKWDFKAAQKPDFLIANSKHTASEIKKYYKREATVIHPPVDIDRFKPYISDSKNRHGYVITGRQTPYKKISLAVAACTKLSVPLVVIGNGPDHKKLKKMAGPSITFVTTATDEDVAKYVGSSKAFIFPGTDDFGIAPVEALAAGTPVIAFKAGGALDYVVDGKNGRFFDKPTVGSLCKAIQKFEKEKYSPEDIKTTSKEFGIDHFHKKMLKFVQKL